MRMNMLIIAQTGNPRGLPDSAQMRPATAHPLLTPHDAEVLASRAITSATATARGYRSITATEATTYGFPAVAGLLIPSHNTAAEVERYQLRPHTAPVNQATGKPRKYLWPSGCRQSLDVPPASLATLRDEATPVIITESALRADAIRSDLALLTMEHRFCVLAVAGVYGWRSGGMPLSDHQDIPWRCKTGERITHRRAVYLAFDSDAATNPNVTRARWEYAAYLRRRGAAVRYIDVPATGDGGKQGVDDFVAAGGDLLALIDTATPAPDIMPAVDASGDASLSEVERLRARIAYLERENVTLVLAGKNPHVAGTTRVMILNAATRVRAKASRGDVEPDGRVRLSPAEISGDYRPKPEPGQPRMKTNPDGSPILMTRSSVKKIAGDARAAGLIDFEMIPVRKARGNGRPYVDHDLLFAPPVSLAEFIAPTARYVPDEPTLRKDYRHQEPCPSCGEVHARTVSTTRTTICGTVNDPGCGAVVRETEQTLTIPVPPADRATITDEQRADLDRETGTGTFFVPIKNVGPLPAPTYYSVTKNVPVHDPPADDAPRQPPGFDGASERRVVW